MTDPKNFLVCPDCENGWDISEGRFCWLCKSEGEPTWDGDDEPA